MAKSVKEMITYPTIGMILAAILIVLAITKMGFVPTIVFTKLVEIIILGVALFILLTETIKDGIQMIFSDVIGILGMIVVGLLILAKIFMVPLGGWATAEVVVYVAFVIIIIYRLLYKKRR